MVLIINEKDNVGVALVDLPEKASTSCKEHTVH